MWVVESGGAGGTTVFGPLQLVSNTRRETRRNREKKG